MEEKFYHYKDRDPKETVRIIKDFFESNGFKIEEKIENPIEGIWWCQIKLIYNNWLILSTNGKGFLKKYALASGYGELYERYCNKSFFWCNPIIQDFLSNSDKENNLELDENILALKKIYPFKNKKNNLFFESMCGENLNLESFINLLTNKIVYYNKTLLTIQCGSTGLAAGNTLEEALVQGISEICERNTVFNLLNGKKVDKIKKISFSNISKNNLNIIKRIEQQGNKVYIYDLSYINNMPVVAVFIFSYYNNKFYSSYGSFPIFDIALERCLTELYQGEFNKLSKNKNWVPYKNIDNINNIIFDIFTTKDYSYFPETILINNVETNYNTEVFLPFIEQYSNHFLLEYYIKLFKNNNINIYYNNNSKIEKMFSVHIYCPEIKWAYYYLQNDKLNYFLNKRQIKLIYNYYIYIKKILHNNLNDKDIKKLIKSFKKNKKLILPLTTDFIFPISKYNYFSHQLICDFINKKELFFSQQDNDLYYIMYLYIFISNYIESNKYTYEEVVKIFSELNIQINKQNIELIKKDKDFYLLKYILPPIIKENYSNEIFIHNMKILYGDNFKQ